LARSNSRYTYLQRAGHSRNMCQSISYRGKRDTHFCRMGRKKSSCPAPWRFRLVDVWTHRSLAAHASSTIHDLDGEESATSQGATRCDLVGVWQFAAPATEYNAATKEVMRMSGGHDLVATHTYLKFYLKSVTLFVTLPETVAVRDHLIKLPRRQQSLVILQVLKLDISLDICVQIFLSVTRHLTIRSDHIY